jgi:FkbM family methyltransferase
VDLRFERDFLDGLYEVPAQEVLTSFLRAGDCFYDVGAHIGFFSLLAARLVGEQGTVIAFEPDPRNAGILRTTAVKNKLSQIRVVEAAVWSSSGALEFERADAASSRVDGQVGQIANLNRDRIRVSGVALDDYVRGRESPPPNFLKIDVEAAELEALQGAAELFKTHRPSLLCEVHNVPNKAKVEAWLQGRLYSLKWLGPQDSLPIQLLALQRSASKKVESNARNLT